MNYAALFKFEKEHPTECSIGCGIFPAHSFAIDVYARDKKDIDVAAKAYGFKKRDQKNPVSFEIRA